MDAPLWTPETPEQTILADFMTKIDKQDMTYPELWAWSCENIEEFWSALWDYCDVIGDKGDVVLKEDAHMRDARFFPESSLNYAENCLKRRDDGDAIIFWGEDKVKTRMSWAQLYEAVSKFQQFLIDQGIEQGDRVAGFVSNMPQALIGMLAASSIGAIWSSASPDFGVQGVLDRFGQIEPKIMIAVEGYYYNGKTVDCMPKITEFLPQLPSVQKCVIVDYTDNRHQLSGNMVRWDDIQNDYEANDIKFTRLPFNHPLFIMFSSGTTGIPKCIVHGQGGVLLTHLKEHQLQCDVKPDDRVFYFTTCGWMMWNWQVTAIASGATLLLYDGSPFYPDANILWDYADAEGMTLFGTAAKYIDALNKNGSKPIETHDLSSIRILTSTGSPLVHESFDYIYGSIKKDIHLASIYGGTDIVCASFGIGNPISPVYRGQLQGAGLATDVDIFNDSGEPMSAGDSAGELVCKRPIPSMPVGFWNDEDGARYHKAYYARFDNIWHHGDFVEKTAEHGLIVHGRSDATLNPGGVRIGTAEIYRQVEQIAEVKESIAIGQDWDGDVRVILFVVMQDGETLTDNIIIKIKKQIKDGASPRHVPAKILEVPDIPRTKSGKITEIAVRDIVHGRVVKNVEALANPEALDHYKNLAVVGL
jgi:acetoacetyl-CoA synthetase